MSQQRGHIKDEADCIRDEFFRDRADRARNGEPSPMTDAAKELAERDRQHTLQLVEKNLVIDRLIRQIERLTSETIHPVTSLRDPDIVLMSDGSVYEMRWPAAADAAIWIEHTPLPRTRRAIAQEIAKEEASDATH
jgi:stalled ribosome alternative rescue factor ArfA